MRRSTAEAASRPDVTLDELRAWLAAEHDLGASLGLMHATLARLGLTRKKDRPCAGAGPAGRRQGTRRLARATGGAARAAADLHRRDRGGQPGSPGGVPLGVAPGWRAEEPAPDPIRGPLPARPAPGLSHPARSLEDDHVPGRAHRQRPHRSSCHRWRHDRRAVPRPGGADAGPGAPAGRVTSVNMVEIRAASEVAIGQAARGGSLKVWGSGASNSAIASTCM